jgi:hypothetical protein
MANKIVLKKSSVAAKVPLSTDLDVGEIAVNLADQKLYSKKTDGTVILVGSAAGGVDSVNGQTGVVVLDAADVGAVGTITSSDGSISVVTTGSTVDIAVSEASPASTLLGSVRNQTGATLTKGTVVYISGATGNKALVSKAIATSDATSAQTYGVITTDLANNANGYVTIVGALTNLNTSAFSEGVQLYLSSTTAGAYTATKQYAPAHLVYVGVVTRSHPTQGSIEVKIQNGYEMDELHNVSAQTPSNGNVLIWNNSTQLWESAGITAGTGISVTNGAGSITVNNTGVTSVGGTGTVNGITLTGAVTTTGNLTLGGTLSGVSLTTQVSGTLPIANGGTGSTTRQEAMDVLAGAVTSGQYLRGNGTDVVMSAIQAADVPTLNQSTTGNAATATTATNLSGGTASATWVNTTQGLTDTTGVASALRVLSPGGASYTGDPVTGSFKIKLPQSWTNTMMRMTIRVYTYDNGSFDIYCGGYSYEPTAAWINTFAYMGSQTREAVTVYFGHDGTSCCIFVGAPGTAWSYPKLYVTDFQAGHSNYAASQWRSGWAVSVVTSLGTITATQSATKTITGQANSATITASTTAGAASTIVQRDGNGYIFNNYFNSTDNSQAGSVSAVMVKAGDNYLRSGTAAAIASFISGQAMNINGTAANASSISSAVGTTYTWPATQQFTGNGNTASAAGIGIQAFSTGGNGAIMAFHRGGAYAVNFGLDSDNVMRIGGWSAAANRWTLDMSGNNTVAGALRGVAGVYSNTNVYTDANYGYGHVGVYDSFRYQGLFSMGSSWSLPADGTSTGNLYGLSWSHPNAGGAASNLGSHGVLLLENGVFKGAWGGGSFRTPGDIRAPIFYDFPDTSWYCDPASTSRFNLLTVPSNVGSGTFPVSINSVDRGIIFGNSSGSGISCYFTVNSGATISGSIIPSGGSTSYNTSSDYRMKENDLNIDTNAALAKIMALRPVTFDWKQKFGGGKGIGFIAHELDLIAPECVSGEKDAVNDDGTISPQSVDASWLIPSLCAAMQKQQKLIEQLTAKVATLEGI